MTREKLGGYQKLVKNICILRLELNDLNTTDAGLGSSTILDYRLGFGRPQAVIGFDAERYEKKKGQLESKEAEAERIRQWVEEIEEPETRQVFKYFYLEGMNWMEIARKTGYPGNPDYPHKMIRDRYLKKCGIK